jgi:hypothetical protein
MTVMTKLKGLTVAAGFAAALLTGSATMAFAGDVTLTMAVPDWPPTRIMKKMFDEQYKSKTGNNVNSVARLLHARQRIADIGRTEVQFRSVGFAMAGCLR